MRGRGAHGADDRVVGLRACDGGKIGKPLADQSRLSAHATGHDHGTARGLRLSDGVEAFLTRRVEESAGVHDDGVGVRIVANRLISLTTKPCQDPLGIHQRLGAAQTDHTDRTAAWRVRLNWSPQGFVRHQRLLVTEDADAGESHRHTRGVSGGDHLGVADGAAWLNDSGRAGFDGLDQSIREREEGL